MRPWWWRQKGPLKRWYASTRLYGATTQETAISIWEDIVGIFTCLQHRFIEWIMGFRVDQTSSFNPRGSKVNVMDQKGSSSLMPRDIIQTAKPLNTCFTFFKTICACWEIFYTFWECPEDCRVRIPVLYVVPEVSSSCHWAYVIPVRHSCLSCFLTSFVLFVMAAWPIVHSV
jgi:hypothetical protein